MPADRPREPPQPRSTALRKEGEPEHLHEGRPFLLGTIHPATDEIRELAGTLGLQLVAEVYQARERPHPGTFFGKGKIQELREAMGALRSGRLPDSWAWTGSAYEPVPKGAEEGTAWGGTPWVRGGPSLDSGDDTTPGEPQGDTLDASDTPASRVALQGKDPALPKADLTTPRGDSDEGRRDPMTSSRRGPREGRMPAGKETVASGAGETEDPEGAMVEHPVPPGSPDLEAMADRDYLLVLNEDVRPAVLFNLEERLGVEVWDRTRLILEIFGQHAHVKEARLQVELAMLQYEIPLIHEAVHRRRTGERPGFMGGGEYEVADYQDFIKRRMRAVKDELEHIRQERGVRRKVRREQFYLVSLAGYTNAGKSSLLNVLTGADVREKWEMFSTLGTTTRRMASSAEILRQRADQKTDERTARTSGQDAVEKEEAPRTETTPETGSGPKTEEAPKDEAASKKEDDPVPSGASVSPGINVYNRPILLTDTVGFIQALPSWLLDAFRSTLEEISLSDVVLLVADVSDPVDVLLEKVRVCREELSFLDVTCPVILVLSKADLTPPEAVEARSLRLIQAGLARADQTVVVSAKTIEGIDLLDSEIHRALPDLIGYRAELPPDDKGQRLLSFLYDWGEVQEVDYGARMIVKGLCDPLHWKGLVREGLASGAEVVRVR